MPEEEKASHVSEEAAGAPADAELDAAIAELTKGETKHEKQEVVVKEGQVKGEVKVKQEPSDQKFKSWLGRKLKEQREEVKRELQADFDEWKASQETKPHGKEASLIQTDELPEYVSTPDDVRKVLRTERQREVEAQKKYEAGYLKAVRSLSTASPDMHDEVFKEMVANFNEKHTGDAVVDARLNYAEARASVLSKKTASTKVKPNVRSEKAEGTNLTVETETKIETEKELELDAFAKEFVNKVGMKKEDVTAALKGEPPIHLTGR